MMEYLFYLFCAVVIGYLVYMYIQGSDLQLTCVISRVDGNQYCVRDRTQVHKAADLLAKVAQKLKTLKEHMEKTLPDHPITQRLSLHFNETKIMETLPTSVMTAYSENKGEKVAFCLQKKNPSETTNAFIDEHTLTFVGIHELTHVGTESIGHEDEFWQNFKFMLQQAEVAGIHRPTDYKKDPTTYCGMELKDNPYYDV
jgi:predicted metal-dependent hydrolase